MRVWCNGSITTCQVVGSDSTSDSRSIPFKEDTMSNNKLPGSFFFCTACGKISLTKTGFDASNNLVADRGWDVSCMLNSTEILTSSIDTEKHLEVLLHLEELCNRLGL